MRFLTSYPKDMTNEIIDSVADCQKVCEHFNIPVQSGSNSMLERMRRGYMVEEFVERVERIRLKMPDAAIATDVIVGCPGETDDEFQETLSLLRKIRFDTIHVAAYSPRPGTFADRKMIDDVPNKIKKQRLHLVEEIHQDSSLNINQELLNKEIEILVESVTGTQATGRTRHGTIVHFNTNGEVKIGNLENIKITRTTAWSLKGHIADSLSLSVV